MTEYDPPQGADEPPADGLDLVIGTITVLAVVLALLWAAGVIHLPGA